MKIKTRLFALLMVIAMLIPSLVACGNETPADNSPTDNNAQTVTLTLNGVSLSDYTIVYSESGLDFNKRAAEYISEEIKAITGTAPAVVLDTEAADAGNEILVGITNRDSDTINTADYEDVFKYATVTTGDSVILYGEEYMIAGAAYALVKSLADNKDVTVPSEVTVGEPVFEDAKNVIFVIGDGMGFNSLALGNQLYATNAYPDKENISGYHQNIVADRLPYKAQSFTHSYDNDVTDSAAGGTALATGYKTYNGVIGLDNQLKPIKNLSELAIELGKDAAVLTTDDTYGATPSAFSVHVLDRNDEDDILVAQQKNNIDYYAALIRDPANAIRKGLDAVDDNENGFFMMHEEAHIDKASHDNNKSKFYTAYTRLNTALRVFLEFMMYNPDTVLILTADHETGAIILNEETGTYEYTSDEHSHVNVPFYAIGKGTEFIDGKIFDNTGVSKFAAQLMGADNFGNPDLEQVINKTGEEKMNDADLVLRYKEKKEAEKNFPGNSAVN